MKTIAKNPDSPSRIFPEPAAAEDRELNLYLWALLAVTNLVDVLASKRAFDVGLEELNPVAASLLAEYGLLGLALCKAFWLAVLVVSLPYIHGWVQKFLALACGAYLGLTILHIWNLSPLL